MPVVLKDAIQNADNTSYLSYAIDGVEFDKKSETPEVHTGRAAVFKYEDVNKNDMAINLWDNKQNNYINLNERLNYITSIYRDINNLYANKSGGSIETVAMDKPLVDLDINALFD